MLRVSIPAEGFVWEQKERRLWAIAFGLAFTLRTPEWQPTFAVVAIEAAGSPAALQIASMMWA